MAAVSRSRSLILRRVDHGYCSAQQRAFQDVARELGAREDETTALRDELGQLLQTACRIDDVVGREDSDAPVGLDAGAEGSQDDGFLESEQCQELAEEVTLRVAQVRKHLTEAARAKSNPPHVTYKCRLVEYRIPLGETVCVDVAGKEYTIFAVADMSAALRPVRPELIAETQQNAVLDENMQRVMQRRHFTWKRSSTIIPINASVMTPDRFGRLVEASVIDVMQPYSDDPSYQVQLDSMYQVYHQTTWVHAERLHNIPRQALQTLSSEDTETRRETQSSPIAAGCPTDGNSDVIDFCVFLCE